ncbi:unnamed protein product [Peronospora destructor]|uniref:Uncharacterized protein n=1 Tax=Peronospora destructor TaxID=86335 RepID=A0AAV0TRQ4_9STRA|nr:unnamed protein product [Peronospora destructor]
MDISSSTSARIGKFQGISFHTWKFKMQMTSKRKSRKALVIICLAMEKSQLPLARSAKDAHDAWSRVEGHFEKKSLANRLFLRRRYLTVMMDDGDDMQEHINKLKTLAEQLDAAGPPVSEDDLVITLLSSLWESYQFLITALESHTHLRGSL